MPKVNNDFSDIMLNRHSVRNYDSSVKISHDEIKEMIAEAISAPSSSNMQSWDFIAIDSPAEKAKLDEAVFPFNKTQIDTCSAAIVVMGNIYSFKRYHKVWDHLLETKKVTKEAHDVALNTFLPAYQNAPVAMLTANAIRDCSLAGMQFMLVAREHGYETNPIAGYDPEKVTKFVGLDPKLYHPAMIITIGKPDKSKKEGKTFRYPVDQVLTFK